MLYQVTKISQDQTVAIFDAFYKSNLVVPTNQYDIVLSYFKGICETTEIANNFTAVFFRLAQENGVDALELLQQLKGQSRNKIDLTKIMAYYFNSFKSKTSLYGISVVPVPNQPVARNVVL